MHDRVVPSRLLHQPSPVFEPQGAANSGDLAAGAADGAGRRQIPPGSQHRNHPAPGFRPVDHVQADREHAGPGLLPIFSARPADRRERFVAAIVLLLETVQLPAPRGVSNQRRGAMRTQLDAAQGGVGLGKIETSQLERAIGVPAGETARRVSRGAHLKRIHIGKIRGRVEAGEPGHQVALHIVPVLGSGGVPRPPAAPHARVRSQHLPPRGMRHFHFVDHGLKRHTNLPQHRAGLHQKDRQRRHG